MLSITPSVTAPPLVAPITAPPMAAMSILADSSIPTHRSSSQHAIPKTGDDRERQPARIS